MDIALTSRKLAIFIDGCYWHACPEHASWPSANAELWKAKLAGNRLRDEQTRVHLETLGWRVVRFWEHENPDAVVSAILRAIAEA
jgi:DNA mismatch endonuclease (patch repair protein)